jgi:dethiobiotin synthetase
MLLNHKRLFITATDTGVGKSIYTSLLALSFLKQGKKVAISKPIQTGDDLDTDLLAKLTDGKVPIFNTYTLKLPAAPSVASKFEKKKIDIKKIISDIKKLEKKFDVVIVEGVGGIAVPVSGIYLVSDLIKDLNYPAIVVARPGLGTINHTVLTLDYAKKKKINVLGFVISGYDKNTKDVAIKTAPGEIKRISGMKCIQKTPRIGKRGLQTSLSLNLTF